MLIPFFAGILIIAILDQAAKFFAAGILMENISVTVIKGIFDLTLKPNYAGGMGFMKNHPKILLFLTLLIVVVAVAYVVIKKPDNKLFLTAITFMLGGAVGNIVDRIRLGYVIDFFDFSQLYFPYIFNIADCFITVGAILFVIYVIFFSDKKEK